MKIINTAVFSVWLALISLLLYKNYIGVPLENGEIIKEAFSKSSSWYDIYVGKKKIGYANTTLEKAGDEIIIRHKREIKILRNKEEKVLIEELRCLGDLSYSLKALEYTSHYKDEEGLKVKGEVREDEIIFFLESPQKKKTYKVATGGKDIFLPITLMFALNQRNPSPDMPFTIPTLDIPTLTIINLKVVLKEIRPVKSGINILSLNKFQAGNSIIWTGENGMIIKEETPSGMNLYLQDESFVNKPDGRVLFDYTSLPFFKSNRFIPDAEALSHLKVKIEGLQLDPQLYKNSHVTLEESTLLIRKANIEKLKEETHTLPYKESEFSSYLKPDKWVMSDYKPLHDTGLIYAKTYQLNALGLANFLESYVFNVIKTSPKFFLFDSGTVLKMLSGDYLEKSVMFASYSRAAGLPTRLIGGLVYRNGYFYFHAWPEVWLDKWIPVDPTLAQFPADATHIPLKEGTLEDIISIIGDLEKIEIEVLEAS